MFEALPEFAQFKAISFYLMAAVMRPLGFLTTFGLMSFALKRGTMIRVGIALALGAPVAASSQPALLELYQQNEFADRLFLPIKELLIGLALGFLASVPFYGFKFAGALVDSYRGEGSNNLTLEGNDQATTLASVFYLSAAATFVFSDGLWHMMRSFYATYTIWPLETFLPAMNPNAYKILIDQVWIIFNTMIRVGAPLLLLMFLAECLLMIGSRVARRFGLNNSAFILKNLVLIFLLPTYIAIVIMIADARIGDVFDIDRTLEAAFQ